MSLFVGRSTPGQEYAHVRHTLLGRGIDRTFPLVLRNRSDLTDRGEESKTKDRSVRCASSYGQRGTNGLGRPNVERVNVRLRRMDGLTAIG
jgi:hypothetical protein